jgi:diketogulonate reductase-like aldo/keto reductase
VIAYSPLARDFHRLRDCDPDGVLETLSRRIGRSPAQIALNWCLSRDGVVVIPKANSAGHIAENCAASGWRLRPEHIALLDASIRHRRRTRFDILVRQHMPGFLRPLALRAADYLPRALRRRLS